MSIWRDVKREATNPAFTEGVRDMLPVTPGIAAWGITTGVALANSGLSLVEASAMTLFVFAGVGRAAVGCLAHRPVRELALCGVQRACAPVLYALPFIEAYGVCLSPH